MYRDKFWNGKKNLPFRTEERSLVADRISPWLQTWDKPRVCQCTKPTELRTNNNRTDGALLCLVSQSCLALCDPLNCSPPGSSVLWDSPGKNTGVGCHALQPRDRTRVSRTAGGFFTIWAPREAQQDRLARANSDCGGRSEVSREGAAGDCEILQLNSTESVDVSSHLLKITDFQTSS